MIPECSQSWPLKLEFCSCKKLLKSARALGAFTVSTFWTLHVVYCTVICALLYIVLYCVLGCTAMLLCHVVYSAVLCRAVLCGVVPCCAALCGAVPCCAVLCWVSTCTVNYKFVNFHLCTSGKFKLETTSRRPSEWIPGNANLHQHERYSSVFWSDLLYSFVDEYHIFVQCAI